MKCGGVGKRHVRFGNEPLLAHGGRGATRERQRNQPGADEHYVKLLPIADSRIYVSHDTVMSRGRTYSLHLMCDLKFVRYRAGRATTGICKTLIKRNERQPMAFPPV